MAQGISFVTVGMRAKAEGGPWRELILFYEFFHPETGRGCGASHQTGWTALVARWIRKR